MAKPAAGSAPASFRDYILDQLADRSSYVAKGMFGGFGLYAGSVMFGILYEGRVYLKVNEKTVDQYMSAEMGCFEPYGDGRKMKSYYEVPAEIVESPTDFRAWADQSARVASVAKKETTQKKATGGTAARNGIVTRPKRGVKRRER